MEIKQYESTRDYGEHDVHQGRRPVLSDFFLSDEGNPVGGDTNGTGFDIEWQNGVKAANGAILEDVLEACLQRLQFYQDSKFACRENALAITKIEEAIHWIDHRTRKRRAAGTEGTYKV